ncbi:MAG: hypothetical protein ACRDTU_05295 [Micromonosporaceae bacterium]
MTRVLQWSDVARNPREVAATVDREGEVRLERGGDGQPFVLMAAATVDATRAGLRTTERLLRNAIAHAIRIGDLDDLLIDTFPWAEFLPAEDRREFSEDFVGTFSECSESGTWLPLHRLVYEWQATTGAIHEDPDLAAHLRGPFDDLGVAPEPDVTADADAR